MLLVKNERSRLFLIIVVTLVLFFVAMYKSMNTPFTLYETDGKIQKIHLNEMLSDNAKRINLRMEVNGEDEVVSISWKKKTVKKERKKKSIVGKESEVREKERLIRKLKKVEKQSLYLPQSLANGKKISWRYEKDQSYLYILLIPPIYIICFITQRKSRKRKTREDIFRRILIEIPQINHRLILLLESGLVIGDALIRIGESYGRKEVSTGRKEVSARKNPVAELIYEATMESKLLNINPIEHFYSRALKLGNPTLSRFASVIYDSANKGSQLKEKLQEEGHLLWNERKKSAQEMGKVAEAKLMLPLSIMLLALLMITAMPAMLNM